MAKDRETVSSEAPLKYDISLLALFDAMQEGVVLQDANGAVIQYNRAALEILGVNKEQLLGTTAFDPSWKVVNEDGSPCRPEQHPSVIARETGQKQKNTVLGVYTSIEKIRWVLVTAVPLFKDGSTAAHQVLVTFQDISEQILARESIRKTKRELRQILNNIPYLVSQWDRNLRNLHANSSFCEYFGLKPEEIKGRHVREILGEELFQKNLNFIQAAMAGNPQTFQREFRDAQGQVRHVLASYVPELVDGVVETMLVTVTDVSDLKKLEDERRELEAKLVNSSKLRSLGVMALGIAHEINNPLAVIYGRSVHLQTQIEKFLANPELLRRSLAEIEAMAERVTKIINSLTAFAGESKGDPMVKISIAEVFFDVMSICSARFRKRGIELKLEIPKDVFIECRSVEISQILMNLLNNAYDAIETLAEKWIQIEVTKSDQMAVISVTDSGAGIPSKVAANIMQPFFTTKEVGKGTGLGLSLARGYAEIHHGRLYYDENSKNTRFVLELPFCQPQTKL